MGRKRRSLRLRVLINDRLVGYLTRSSAGAIDFAYAPEWLDWPHAIPASLSLPLREDPWRGAPVIAVFDNLLPDSDTLRRRVAERVGARGTDAFSLLAAIGHDCVGAMQFVEDDDRHEPVVASTRAEITGEAIDDQGIEALLKGLAQAPLGLSRDDPFRISVAGAQEKTALTRHHNRWLKPHGTTPTTHIFKTRIGQLQNGIDLTDSIENEYYCLKLAECFGLPVNPAAIHTFGATQALVVERFDRHWTADERLLRVPQEDCCQALSVPSTQKYQSDGGPGIADVLALLQGSDEPDGDRAIAFEAQILFWLIGATDGHAKNFSVFLRPDGGFQLTPLYDILTAQPSLDRRRIEPKQLKLAMSLGSNRHYRIKEIVRRHFVQTGKEAGLPGKLIHHALDEVTDTAEHALADVTDKLPDNFPASIHESIHKAVRSRLRALKAG